MAKGHLKSALLSQQSRLKAKEKIAHAAQVQNQKIAALRGKHGARNGELSALGVGSSTSSVAGGATKGKGKGKATLKSKSNAVPSSASSSATRKPTIPFSPNDRILLIGEGNFSFARALVLNPPSEELDSLPPQNVTATAYDSEEVCYEKYDDAREIVKELREGGVQILFGVDATRLNREAALKGKEWDRIVWNFPHAGKGIKDQDRNILSNQRLVLDFLASAAKVLYRGPVPTLPSGKKKKKKKKADDDDEEEEEYEQDEVMMDDDDLEPFSTERPKSRGTVLITLRNVAPYTTWDIPRLAKNPPPAQLSALPYPKWTVLRSFRFYRDSWKGYEHRMTKGTRAGGTGRTGEGGEDRTWEFYLSPKEAYQ
ncbi:hypothetical protein FA15DRAFT_702497 [Coprinopsis marcescibilis]|uniref:25S rRNA (uridine-N(3))-methyltransferase BMT5-like domain-containing protein n=1 Tax=Coprinopsis marcescibilis TaxID=230819 RepID=A0A5C3L2A8_COPMA|nr:hypothetical protein FA15DRAFT_702497 [Coprinopsis marcescibilis]